MRAPSAETNATPFLDQGSLPARVPATESSAAIPQQLPGRPSVTPLAVGDEGTLGRFEQIRIRRAFDPRPVLWYGAPMSEESVPKAAMSAEERRIRSRLAQLVGGRGLLRGFVQERFRTCGKPTCRCARGQKHRAVYLVVSEGGRPRQVYVPESWEGTVRQWVQNYQQVRDRLEEISEIYQEKVRRRQG